MAPVPVSNVAPAGRAGLMLQLSVPAQSVFVAEGVTVSVDCSSTVWSATSAIVTVPARWLTWTENVAAPLYVCPPTAVTVAVSVYGP